MRFTGTLTPFWARSLAWVCLVGAVLAAVSARGFVLEVQMANPSGGPAALYYDIGQWYSERDSCHVTLPAASELGPVRFKIAPGIIRRLRLDVAYAPGTVKVGAIRLFSDEGGLLEQMGPESLVALQGVRSLEIRQGVAQVEVDGGNPMLIVNRPLQATSMRALGIAPIGAAQVALLSVGVFGVILVALWGLLANLPARRRALWSFCGSFLVVFGARLTWLLVYGSALPFWDEWERDGSGLLTAYQQHALTWGALLDPQSEHRTLVGRLAVLGSSLLNGEWDPRVGMTIGAAFEAVSLALVCALAAGLRLRYAPAVVIAVCLVGAMPFDPNNLLWGDQCQMYSLNLLATMVLALAVLEPTPFVTTAAVLASAVSLFTMASGCVAPLLGGGLALVRAVSANGRRGRYAAHAAGLLACGVLGLALYQSAPFQAPTYAHSMSGWFGAFIARMAWPMAPGVMHAVLEWTPWILLLAVTGKNAVKGERGSGFVLLLGLWVLANAAALAHGRAQDPFPYDNKYHTSMILVGVVGVFALALLAEASPSRMWALVGASAWLLPCFSLVILLADSPGKARAYADWMKTCDGVVRAYLRSGDRSILSGAPAGSLAYWNGAELAAQLDSPDQQVWLPSVLRRAAAQRPNSPLKGPQEAGSVTLFCRSLMKAGPFLAFLGCVIVVLGRLPFAGKASLLAKDADQGVADRNPGSGRRKMDDEEERGREDRA